MSKKLIITGESAGYSKCLFVPLYYKVVGYLGLMFLFLFLQESLVGFLSHQGVQLPSVGHLDPEDPAFFIGRGVD